MCLSIDAATELSLVAAFDSFQPALAWLANAEFDVLLTDLELPDGSGVDLIRTCSARHPAVDIMVLTTSSNESDVLACIEAGAAGYLVKGMSPNDITSSILTLRAGGAPISPTIARMVLERVRIARPDGIADGRTAALAAEPLSRPQLTKKETEILDLIAQGETYITIAAMLSVSVGTVQTHIKNIYGKLAVHSRGEAVFEAQRHGLLSRSAAGAKH